MAHSSIVVFLLTRCHSIARERCWNVCHQEDSLIRCHTSFIDISSGLKKQISDTFDQSSSFFLRLPLQSQHGYGHISPWNQGLSGGIPTDPNAWLRFMNRRVEVNMRYLGAVGWQPTTLIGNNVVYEQQGWGSTWSILGRRLATYIIYWQQWCGLWTAGSGSTWCILGLYVALIGSLSRCAWCANGPSAPFPQRTTRRSAIVACRASACQEQGVGRDHRIKIT